MTSKLNRLSYAFSCIRKKKLHLTNGEAVSVSYTGCYNTVRGDVLDNILVAPAFKYDLLSVS